MIAMDPDTCAYVQSSTTGGSFRVEGQTSLNKNNQPTEQQ